MMGPKRGLGLLGLCAVLVGLVVLGTSAVQAEKTAKWTVTNAKGEQIDAAVLSPTVLLKSVVTDMVLTSKVAGIKMELLCKKAQFIGAKLEGEGKVSAGNKTKFEECVIRLNGVVSTACEPHNGAEKGVFVSNSLKGLLVLHELAGGAKDPLILFEPVEGTSFVTIALSEECAIGSTCTIIGKSTVKDSEGRFEEQLVEHTVEQGPLSELWVGSKTAEHVAVISGAARLGLSGEHAGLKWGGTPG
jgi:hypothetical protein